MWDKSLDEGIFLCDHESHILTADFLESLCYVNAQMQMSFWNEPGEFMMNEIDFISYILLKNSKEIQDRVFYNYKNIQLSNKRKNQLFQSKLYQDEWKNQLFIYKLFEQDVKFDSVCSRCHNFLNIWDTFCKKCVSYDEDYDHSFKLPKIGTMNCHTCEGFYYRFDEKPVTYYCEYSTITNYRSSNNCKNCDEHFDGLENKMKVNLTEK